MEPFQVLPVELINEITWRLDHISLISFRQTCKHFVDWLGNDYLHNLLKVELASHAHSNTHLMNLSQLKYVSLRHMFRSQGKYKALYGPCVLHKSKPYVIYCGLNHNGIQTKKRHISFLGSGALSFGFPQGETLQRGIISGAKSTVIYLYRDGTVRLNASDTVEIQDAIVKMSTGLVSLFLTSTGKVWCIYPISDTREDTTIMLDIEDVVDIASSGGAFLLLTGSQKVYRGYITNQYTCNVYLVSITQPVISIHAAAQQVFFTTMDGYLYNGSYGEPSIVDGIRHVCAISSNYSAIEIRNMLFLTRSGRVYFRTFNRNQGRWSSIREVCITK